MDKHHRVIIFDTTLRDGEQTPGAAMTQEEKLRIALQLEKLGVDVIEAGFAAASAGDFTAIENIASSVRRSTICSLARANEKDIQRAGQALSTAKRKRIHVFIATSPLHMQQKLHKKPDEVLKIAVQAVQFARTFVDDVEFSAEDGFRSEIPFLKEIFSAVIEAGAKTINLPDTVGYSLPQVSKALFAQLIHTVCKANEVIWSAHCHDDLGLAVANSIAALEGGARQVECTINGLGERAGNASLEEIVMALRTRQDVLGLSTGIKTQEIVSTSKLVSTITGYPVPANKAIVGANAFTHESGIHQDGVLKCRETYEIISPESVGWQSNHLTLGKLSGRNAFKMKLQELGIHLNSEKQLNAAFTRFKELADKKRQIYDEDLHALVSDEMSNMINSAAPLCLVSLKIDMETGEQPLAKICFYVEDQEKIARASGAGAVDSVFKAIESIMHSGAVLELYCVNAITEGTESQAEVSIRLKKDQEIFGGQGADLDIITASAKAYLAAIGKWYQRQVIDQRVIKST